MSEFLATLTHGRKLQGAVKELPLDELKLVAEKLQNIIEKRQQKEAELQQLQQQKKQKIEELRQQIEDAGLDLSDFEALNGKTSKPAKPQKKRPVKYRIKGDDGQITEWTGIGRMPVVFTKALKAGKSLEDFSI
ncbi:H-NS family nucleoid-associated regulatory protein [Neptunicella marina]|uniref:DNA-binding protein n=1 Tax=Neptunicella marina TaxID=2125989 RepID=A0A8J6M076_9ALTE|nr:H-NS family nucleoid-associated regulatory protein [Neptunicella marina]MBC3764348.1 H-NS histone family protein [Neptunicella marina]